MSQKLNLSNFAITYKKKNRSKTILQIKRKKKSNTNHNKKEKYKNFIASPHNKKEKKMKSTQNREANAKKMIT